MRTTLIEVPQYHAHKFKLFTTILSLTNYCYLPGSFQTAAKISRVGHAHPDFLPLLGCSSAPPCVGAPGHTHTDIIKICRS